MAAKGMRPEAIGVAVLPPVGGEPNVIAGRLLLFDRPVVGDNEAIVGNARRAVLEGRADRIGQLFFCCRREIDALDFLEAETFLSPLGELPADAASGRKGRAKANTTSASRQSRASVCRWIRSS